MAFRHALAVLAFGIGALGPAAHAATEATRIGPANATTAYTVTQGDVLSGLMIVTLDDAMVPVGNQYYMVAATCGEFQGSTVPLMTNASGIGTLPSWVFHGQGTCYITASLLPPHSDAFVRFTVTVNPATVLGGLERLENVDIYNVPIGTTLKDVHFGTVDGSGARVGGKVVAFGASCGSFGGQSNVTATSNSAGIATMPDWSPSEFAQVGTTCLISVMRLDLPGAGALFVFANVSAPPPTGGASPVTAASGTSPLGGTITLSLSSTSATCALVQAVFVDPRLVTPPIVSPSALAAPHGWLDFTTRECGMGQPVAFSVDYPQELPPTAQWWKYGPTPDNRTAHWYTIPSTVSGKRITFTITDGGLGDDDLMANGAIVDLGMLAIPGGMMQDLWWSGAAENGWGMSLMQHRDVLFANIFAYDGQGVATWYVMPSGSWNADHTVYTGNLYLPKGSPFYAYDGSKFDIGASVGTMRLTFIDANQASFDYTINGVTGHKDIRKILFGPPSPPLDKPLADLWWAGSAQNGWGIALLQQYSTLFALWFTYDANGKATWFVMPDGNWVARDDYRGNIYKAVGPPWLGVPYDVSRHRTIESGAFRLRFGADAVTFDYTLDGKTGSIPLTRIGF